MQQLYRKKTLAWLNNWFKYVYLCSIYSSSCRASWCFSSKANNLGTCVYGLKWTSLIFPVEILERKGGDVLLDKRIRDMNDIQPHTLPMRIVIAWSNLERVLDQICTHGSTTMNAKVKHKQWLSGTSLLRGRCPRDEPLSISRGQRLQLL